MTSSPAAPPQLAHLFVAAALLGCTEEGILLELLLLTGTAAESDSRKSVEKSGSSERGLPSYQASERTGEFLCKMAQDGVLPILHLLTHGQFSCTTEEAPDRPRKWTFLAGWSSLSASFELGWKLLKRDLAKTNERKDGRKKSLEKRVQRNKKRKGPSHKKKRAVEPFGEQDTPELIISNNIEEGGEGYSECVLPTRTLSSLRNKM